MTDGKPNAPSKSTQASPDATLSPIEQVRVRYEKLAKIRARGDNPYKNRIVPSAACEELQREYAETAAPALEQLGREVRIAGRVLAIRDFGKAGFLQIRDASGRIQFYCQLDRLGPEAFGRYRELDTGDFVYGRGKLFKSKTGELSVACEEFSLITKSLQPLPEKWHGLADVETRYRQRYVDLIVTQKSRETFAKRAKLVQVVREFFVARGFMEVETPMLHPIAGGAAARPFITHHNALDMELYLRIAPELYLKRLVVGGFERVFEINRNFRNEGLSIKHNPEFTMLEFYQAYATYEDLMELTEALFAEAATRVCGSTLVTYQGTEIELGGRWERISVEDAILKHSAFDGSKQQLRERERLLAYGARSGIAMDPKAKLGQLLMAIFDAEVEAKLVQPTFVTHYPLDVSPLSRRNEQDPFVVDRFELFIYGREMANAFSELNDPEDQRERFLEQVRAKASGDLEASDMDHDFVTALEFGMPPTAGQGIGIDRLAMLLTDSASIRDVILFPHMRPLPSPG